LLLSAGYSYRDGDFDSACTPGNVGAVFALEDVKAIAFDVLRHRVLVTYEAEAEEVTPESIVQRVLDVIEVP